MTRPEPTPEDTAAYTLCALAARRRDGAREKMQRAQLARSKGEAMQELQAGDRNQRGQEPGQAPADHAGQGTERQ